MLGVVGAYQRVMFVNHIPHATSKFLLLVAKFYSSFLLKTCHSFAEDVRESLNIDSHSSS